ncbi:class I adenylate-forming enzyme family protein [Ramlibacter albus]|uniref:AMP-binding protein n=1 Tax=Ramlibacter albus TaxID=2079448 RepID=A0A923M4Y7_9BURK|nr:AMP-binding protein [Ramlibacter albus]MBC5763003.1 AMP-binding protein [Ramlibacter albus]
MSTLAEMISACGRNLPLKTAFVQGTRTATWKQVDERSSRFASALADLGIRRGDAVAILSQERIEVYEHWFGCIKAGAMRVGINWRYSVREMQHILVDCRPKLLLVDAHCAASVPALAPTLAALGCKVVGFGDGHGQLLDYEALLSTTSPAREPVPYTGDETVLITYTSGTTGFPKGVMVSERAVRKAILYTALFSGVSADDVWYRPNQSSWIVLIGNSCGLANGVTMVIPDGVFEVKAFLRDIERLRVSVALLVPTSLQRMLDECRDGTYDLSSLRTLIYGGGPISPRLLRRAQEELRCRMVQVYGLTEATWVSYLRDGDHVSGLAERPALLESAGTIATHFEASIRDEDGQPVPSGSIGTLWLRGPCVMSGYLNLPELTASVLKPDGWLITHDMGYLDDSGYLFLKDRKNFLIVTGGVNVYGSAVEAVLAEHPAISEVAVVGLPDERWGETVAAVVVVVPGGEIDLAGLRSFCEGKLARMEIPKRLFTVLELPRTFTGKIDKVSIRSSLLEQD